MNEMNVVGLLGLLVMLGLLTQWYYIRKSYLRRDEARDIIKGMFKNREKDSLNELRDTLTAEIQDVLRENHRATINSKVARHKENRVNKYKISNKRAIVNAIKCFNEEGKTPTVKDVCDVVDLSRNTIRLHINSMVESRTLIKLSSYSNLKISGKSGSGSMYKHKKFIKEEIRQTGLLS